MILVTNLAIFKAEVLSTLLEYFVEASQRKFYYNQNCEQYFSKYFETSLVCGLHKQTFILTEFLYLGYYLLIPI